MSGQFIGMTAEDWAVILDVLDLGLETPDHPLYPDGMTIKECGESPYCKPDDVNRRMVEAVAKLKRLIAA